MCFEDLIVRWTGGRGTGRGGRGEGEEALALGNGLVANVSARTIACGMQPPYALYSCPSSTPPPPPGDKGNGAPGWYPGPPLKRSLNAPQAPKGVQVDKGSGRARAQRAVTLPGTAPWVVDMHPNKRPGGLRDGADGERRPGKRVRCRRPDGVWDEVRIVLVMWSLAPPPPPEREVEREG